MHLRTRILTPEGVVLDEQAESVTIPGDAGSMGILPRHAPLLTSVTDGIVKVTHEHGRTFFVVGRGAARVSREGVLILAETAVRAAGEGDANVKLDERRSRAGG